MSSHDRGRAVAHRWRVPALTVAAFILLGLFLPLFQPGFRAGEKRPVSVVSAVCSVLFWADTLLLPRAARGSVKIPVNLLTSAGWGLVVGLLLSLVRRGARAPAKRR